MGGGEGVRFQVLRVNIYGQKLMQVCLVHMLWFSLSLVQFSITFVFGYGNV